MAKRKPIVPGEIFGRLTIISSAPKNQGDIHRRVLARCECGEVRNIMYSCVVTGKTVSCGCYRKTKNIKHGHTKGSKQTKTYSCYRDMITRCTNKNYREFYLYGGRGIKICDRWMQSYENFLEDMGECPKNLTLERKNYNGNYSPENCCWATMLDQGNNKRNNVLLSLNGRIQTAAQWSRELGISIWNIYSRKRLGWSDYRILSTP